METHAIIKNSVKVYPTRLKIYEYKSPYLKKKPGTKPADEWTDIHLYHRYVVDKAFSDPPQSPQLPKTYMQLALPYNAQYKRFLDALSREQKVQISHDDIIKRMHSIDVSLKRTKQNIFDILECNDFDLFVTFSFGKDHYDIKKCKQRMQKWIENQQFWHKTNGFQPFTYMLIPEYHKDKRAIHFHAMINGYRNTLRKSVHPRTGRQVIQKGKKIYNIPSYTAGFTNASFIKNKEATSRYIAKYVTKDIILLPNQKRYWCSRSLKRPLRLYNEDLNGLDMDLIFEDRKVAISVSRDTIRSQQK